MEGVLSLDDVTVRVLPSSIQVLISQNQTVQVRIIVTSHSLSTGLPMGGEKKESLKTGFDFRSKSWVQVPRRAI